MSFLKVALLLTFAGLLTGLAISLLFTPRWVSRGVIEAKGEFNSNLTNEEIAAIIENQQPTLFDDERARVPYQAIGIARNAIQISVVKPEAAQGLALIVIRVTYRNRTGANVLASRVVTMLINKQASGLREKVLRARVEQLKLHLAALKAHSPVPPLLTGSRVVGFEILDYPTVSIRPEFPNRLAMMLTGGLIALLIAIPISRRTRYH